VNRFLIVRLGSLGDVVHGIPVAAALRQAFPTSRIDWMVDPRYVELLNLVTSLDRRIPVDPREAKQGRARQRLSQNVREMRDIGYDAVIDLQGLVKSAVLARSVRARRTIGFPRKHLREPLARLFYTDAPDPGAATHVIYKNLALLAPLRVNDHTVRFPLVIPRSPIGEQIRERMEGREYAIINPGAAWPNKRWPPARFGAVAAAMMRDFGWRSLVLWGPGEEDLADAVVAASDGSAIMSPPTSITDIVAIAKNARLMISGDTGPLHIAAAVGAPVVGLYGPTRPERNGPWGPADVALSRVHRCSCVYERTCRKAERCIDDISVDDVVAAVQRRLAA
jgi:lipopolysaccharide heptosyltransferase I